MKAFAVAAFVLAAVAAPSAQAADSVMLTGTIGSRAILIVNGSAPKTVAVGESFQGVKLVSLQSEQAVVESEGKRVTLRMDTPVSIGGGGSSGGSGTMDRSRCARQHAATSSADNARPQIERSARPTPFRSPPFERLPTVSAADVLIDFSWSWFLSILGFCGLPS